MVVHSASLKNGAHSFADSSLTSETVSYIFFLFCAAQLGDFLKKTEKIVYTFNLPSTDTLPESSQGHFK